MSIESGCFQMLLTASQYGATGPAGDAINYPLNLSGNYKLTLKSAQIHLYPEVSEVDTFPIEIYSPNLLFSYAPTQLYPTLLYPRAVNNAYQANLDIDIHVSLNSNIQLQLRHAITKENIPFFKLAVLTWYYEKHL